MGDILIDTYLLEYFIAIYEEGTLLKASKRLLVSQPSLTKAMQKLEYQLGINLFERGPNKITINKNGEALIEYAKDIISLENRLSEKARELKRQQAIIHIDMTAPGPTFMFPNFFYYNEPRQYSLKIIDEKDCVKELRQGLVDIIFINSQINDNDLKCEKIVDEKLYVSLPANHPYSNKKSITYKELDGFTFLIVKNLGIWDHIVAQKIPNSKLLKQDLATINDLIDESSIPSFVTNISIIYHKKNNNRVLIPIEDKLSTISFYAVCRKNKDILKILKNIG